MPDLQGIIGLTLLLGAIGALWARLEHRLTRLETRQDKLSEDFKDTRDRVAKIEPFIRKRREGPF